MSAHEGEGERAAQLAAVLRPLGQGPLTRDQAAAAANLLGVHWTTVYRLRRRFLADPVMSSMSGRSRGPKSGDRRLEVAVDHVINDVIRDWLPKQRQLAHPSTDLVLEVRRRCALAQLALPSRNTVARRWANNEKSTHLSARR